MPLAALILAAAVAGAEPVPDTVVAPTCAEAVEKLRAALARAPGPAEPTIVCLGGKAMVAEERPKEALPAKPGRCRAGGCVVPAATPADERSRRR